MYAPVLTRPTNGPEIVRAPITGYDPADPSSMPTEAEYEAAKEVVEALEKAYPGYCWGATACKQARIIQVVSGMLPPGFGFILHFLQENQALRKKAIKWGGELLERYGLARGARSRATQMRKTPEL